MHTPESGLHVANGQPSASGSRTGGVSVRQFDAEDLPARDRFPYWREAVCDSVAGVEISRTGEEPFRGRIHCRGVDLDAGERALFIDIASVPQAASHRRRHIAKETDAWLNLVIASQGRSRSNQAGHSLLVEPGDMILKDVTRPSEIRFDQPYRQLVLKMPRRRFAWRLPREPLWMRRAINARTPLGSVLKADVVSLWGAIDVVRPELHRALVDRTVDLIALAFAGESRNFGGCGSTVRRALVIRATQFIDAHLGDPELCGETVAASLGISLGYLQHLFQAAEMTVGGYARRRRLEHCRNDLADPMRGGELVSEIAMRWGFRDMPWFSRAYHRAFGLAPRDHRALAAEARARLEIKPA